MKKIILVAALGIAGLASAKNIDVKKDKNDEKIEKKSKDTKSSEESEALKMQCMQVGMLVWCTNEVVSDTVCWGEGSGTSTYEQAVSDSIHNSQLLTEFTCGAGTGSGPGGN
ncbi:MULTISPECIES: hypothetical protein [Chryseobacterium]|uniref:Uncharacterized protein n=1 Tax=Chryseobacterium camelliae TaxID=1265445 RepID=A0ABU0TKK4_9FLAO|nr:MULTISPECIES: hypothetical protein [Chryseobacterium]MDT3408556.1 hypothetical protein [Pseudacidovorax intermedius]MDQ1097589.1 hypothetical protein [Chryseobacterium camelliae]MDQ1101518.1 hypothetical protein [Chryseobacterium sp. SORGH_AS_1048]MDR6084961.1 hypothetical protein [Chryseobacterium sp. SORGH_AS_0909]MDR6129314.1 hypothetical protein [Chryseobacterium sp. SORGH_AS_1175]